MRYPGLNPEQNQDTGEIQVNSKLTIVQLTVLNQPVLIIVPWLNKRLTLGKAEGKGHGNLLYNFAILLQV